MALQPCGGTAAWHPLRVESSSVLTRETAIVDKPAEAEDDGHGHGHHHH